MRTTVTVGSAFHTVPIDEHFNNVAATRADDLAPGGFNVWRNSYPAEHLPAPGTVRVNGVPFRLPPYGGGRPDNVRCAGQYVPVPAGRYDWLHLLAAAERRAEDQIALHFADGSVDFEALRVSDFWASTAAFGEPRAFATPVMHYPHHVQQRLSALVWAPRVPVTRPGALVGLRLPDNVAIHVFAMTLRAAPPDEAATVEEGTDER